MPVDNRQSASPIGQIGRLMAEKLLVEVTSPDQDLVASGLIDSLTLIQLLTILEEYFGVRIPLEELQIEDIRSINSLARLVENHKYAPAGG
jgi:acyl carrier protein